MCSHCTECSHFEYNKKALLLLDIDLIESILEEREMGWQGDRAIRENVNCLSFLHPIRGRERRGEERDL